MNATEKERLQDFGVKYEYSKRAKRVCVVDGVMKKSIRGEVC